MMIILFNLFLLVHASPVQDAKEELKSKMNLTTSCAFLVTDKIQKQTLVNKSEKIIRVRKSYWNNINYKAKKVTAIREFLHCDGGYNYLRGVSIMNKKIIQAVNAYEYGAD